MKQFKHDWKAVSWCFRALLAHSLKHLQHVLHLDIPALDSWDLTIGHLRVLHHDEVQTEQTNVPVLT